MNSVVYKHPAYPPYGIKLNISYRLQERNDCFFVIIDEEKVEFKKDLLIALFQLKDKDGKSVDWDKYFSENEKIIVKSKNKEENVKVFDKKKNRR